jgi:hypothetical protein
MTRRRLRHELALSRRTLLRGAVAGATVTVALPLLEAMVNDNGDALAGGEPLPSRLLTWMFGNGCTLANWVPANQGPSYSMSSELAPLAAYRDSFTVLSGFQNLVAGRRGHHDGMAGLWSGWPFVRLDPMGAPYASKFGGKSIDQIAADLMGDDSFFKSLQVGVTKRYEAEQGPTLATMSHRGPDQPLAMERDPLALYDRLFNSFLPTDDPTGIARLAALDAIYADAERLKARVGAADRQRLDAHVEGIFRVQRQILAIPPDCNVPDPPTVDPYIEGGSEPLWELNQVMVELVAMALSCGLTNVASFMFTGPSGAQQFHMLPPAEFPEYPDAEDYSHADHHSVSHSNLPYEQEFIHRSVMFSMECLGALIGHFASIEEGAGSLLDNCCIFASSDVTEGWSHSEDDFPIIIAGGAGGRLRRDVGHYRSSTQESVSDIGLACLKAIAPNPDEVTEYGGDDGSYSGHTTTPCAAILA